MDHTGETGFGLTLDEAVEAVLERNPDATPADVRSRLDRVTTDDGIVTRSAIETAVGETAQYVATAENRLEMATEAVDAAQAAPGPAADLDAVRSRLDSLETAHDRRSAEVESLQARLADLVDADRSPADIDRLARSVGDIRADARTAHRRVEDVRDDAQAFERWATDTERRWAELADDIDAAGGYLDDVADLVEALESDPDALDDTDRTWAAASLRHRVMAVLLADLRAELADLRSWPGDDSAPPDGLPDRIDTLAARNRRLGDALDALATPARRDRFGGTIDALEADLDAIDPPVGWGRVQDCLAERLADLEPADP